MGEEGQKVYHEQSMHFERVRRGARGEGPLWRLLLPEMGRLRWTLWGRRARAGQGERVVTMERAAVVFQKKLLQMSRLNQFTWK